jgi:hypothetical protein
LTRILLDQNVPHGLRGLLPDHEVVTAARLGWQRLANGELLDAAEAAGFEILVTGDKNLGYQQSLAARKIGVLILSSTRWAELRDQAPRIQAAAVDCVAGAVIRLDP